MDRSHKGTANRSNGGRVQHRLHEHTRLTNRFQPGHKFLDQLLSKSPMCLVNEIGRYHNFKPDYILLDTSGPDHKKQFSVALQFGTYEKFIGEGSSIKNAQRNAAILGLQNTQLSFPRAQNGTILSPANQWSGSGPIAQTPASELNTLLMKKGVQPKYELTAEKICNENVNSNTYGNVDSNMHFANLSDNFHSKPPLLPSPVRHPKGIQLFNKLDTDFNQKPYQLPISMIPHSFAPTGYMIPHPPPSYMFPASPYIRPNHSQSACPFPVRAQIPSHYPPYNSNFNYGHFNSMPVNSYQNMKQSGPNANKWNIFPQNPFHLHNNSHTTTNFEAKVEFDGHQFSGKGRTVQAARHSAANEALKFVKSQSQPVKGQEGIEQRQARSTSQTSSSSENEGQSPISLVYEFASRNCFNVLFEVICECGHNHIPAFLMRCSLYSDDLKQPYITADGEDRSKKAAKRAAAQAVLTMINEKKVTPDTSPPNFAKILSRPKKSNDQTTSDHHQTNVDFESSISCKYVTLLYQLTRNMLISSPVYSSLAVDETDELTANFKATIDDTADSKSSHIKLYKVECALTFEQRLPQYLTCLVKAVGYGTNPRVAKSISTYICLLKIGATVPPIDNSVTKSLLFSLARNLNVPEQAVASVEDDNDTEPNCTVDSPAEKQVIDSIEENLQFVINILGKLYLFTLKDSTKSMGHIFGKLESTLTTFYANKYPEVSNAKMAAKCDLLQKRMATLDGNKYWSHLEIISYLVSLGLETAQLPTQKPLLQFKSHFVVSEDERDSSAPHFVSIISGHCNVFLSSTFKFALIKKNFVNFGLGSNQEKAREMASYWILKHLAYHARKQMIESEFDQMTETMEQCNLTDSLTTASVKGSGGSQSTGDSISTGEKALRSKSKSSSCASYGQLVSKHCITQLFKACSELNIRKPVFENEKWSADSVANPDKVQLAPNLMRVTCMLSFIQEVPDPLTTKIVISAIAPSQRLGRTICAYVALCKLGLSPSTHLHELSTMEYFETYLRLSQCNVPPPSAQQVEKSNRLLEANIDEIGRNLDFVVRILQDIYRPFLKNHKMSCPSSLFVRVEQELFEYHNHQQQIMDESGTFDRCSANIEKSVKELMRRFDDTQFWDHLLLLSSIASLLTANLDQPLEPGVLQFQCQVSKHAELAKSGKQQSSELPVSVAVISVNSPLPCTQTRELTRKSFLGFSLGQSEEVAKETAAYLALRRLAINLWK